MQQSHSKIQNEDLVQFVFRRINKNDSFYFIYKIGLVVDRKEKLLIIKYKNRLYKVSEKIHILQEHQLTLSIICFGYVPVNFSDFNVNIFYVDKSLIC